MTSFSLRTYLIAACAFIPLLLTVAIITVYSSRFKDYAIDNLTAHGLADTRNIAFSVADDLITENYAPLQEYIRDFIASAVDAVQISDRDGIILAASEVELLGTKMTKESGGNYLFNSLDVSIRIDEDLAQFVFTAPVLVGETELGTTRVFVSMRPMLSHVREIQKSGALIGLCFWLFAVALGIFLARFLVNPVQRFMAAADSISQGDFKVEIPEARRVTELNRFGSTLKVMATALASREQKLQDSEKKFRQLFERAIEGIFVADG
jgi:methyl-accepting chemotaxis protein